MLKGGPVEESGGGRSRLVQGEVGQRPNPSDQLAHRNGACPPNTLMSGVTLQSRRKNISSIIALLPRCTPLPGTTTAAHIPRIRSTSAHGICITSHRRGGAISCRLLTDSRRPSQGHQAASNRELSLKE